MSKNDHILVVEDQPAVRMCLVQILDRAGYQVLTASNGLEALDLLKSNPVDLILADIMMPEMDGYTLYEHVVENPHWVTVPFVFLTARVLDTDIRYGKELGVDDYLIKPISANDLLATVRGKLRRAEQIAQTAGVPDQPSLPGSEVIVLGQLQIEPGEYRAYLKGELLKISNTEFRALEHLAQQTGRVVGMQELIKVTHDFETSYTEASNLLRPIIRSLRRKMGYAAGDMGCIESVRGVGYRLVPPGDTPGSE